MDMKQYIDRLQTVEARMKEIQKNVDETAGEALRNLQTENNELVEERDTLLSKINILERGNFTPYKEQNDPESNTTERNKTPDYEERGAQLKGRKSIVLEARDLTVGTNKVPLANHLSGDINSFFNSVSSLIDAVLQVPLDGGESYRKAYITGYGEGGYTKQGDPYTDVDTTYEYAEISKTKITAYEEIPEELEKLPNAPYATHVQNGVVIAQRRKISREILLGDGTNEHLTGIFSSQAKAIDASTDISLSAIDEFTLEELVYGYGGDEDVEGYQALILNKKDLQSFAKVRDVNGNRVYNIINLGNVGTINGIYYIINSACKSLGDSATSVGDYVMTYGNLGAYELATFSGMNVRRSDEFKFKEGQIAFRGSIFVGGNVTSKNAFLRVKKK